VLAERPGSDSVDALVAGAQSDKEGVAIAALRALSLVGAATEVPAVLSVLTGTNSDGVREAASGALVACIQRSQDREAALAHVVQAASSAGIPARAALLGVMAQTGGQTALEELRKAASSSDAEIVRAAVQGLADAWSDGSARPVLLDIARNNQQKAIRVIALRGFLRLVSQDAGMQPDEKVTALEEAIKIAERPDEKRQALGALRDCRTERAVTLAASLLSDKELFTDAAETILDLASAQRRNDRDLPAVKGPTVSEALDKIIQMTDDEALKDRARKLR